MPTALDFIPLLPTFLLIIGGCLLLLSEVFLSETADRRYQSALTVGISLAAMVAALWQLGAPEARPIFQGAAMADDFSAFVTAIISAGLLLSALVARGFLQRHDAERGEFYALLLLGAAGMSLLAMSFDLMMLFIALEIMSVATYALSAWLRRGSRPSESAFKYFLLGAFSSALYLYGTALVYGATGTTRMAALAQTTGISSLMLPGLALIAVGFAFKVGAVPFHMWAPDVYEGAPTPVTAFMAVGVKAAAFAAFLRTFGVAFGDSAGVWEPLIMVLAGLTMLVGNVLALPQRNVKRMLAYSSIAHAGYLLLALAATRVESAKVAAGGSMLFYLAAYTFTAIGAFGIIAALERRESEHANAWDLDRFAGLAKRRPVMAFFMTVFMLSLAGIPPTAGFMAKLFIFKAAIDAGMVGLAILGMVTSAIGVYYYLRVVVYMYFRNPEPHGVVERLPALEWGLGIASVLVVVLGVGPDFVVEAARQSARLLW